MAPTENDSDTRLFRFDKKMFLELASDDEQDNSHAYGNVVTQIYIEEKDGTELKKLKDEKQVSDLKRELKIDDLQNTEVIEKRKKEKEIERVKKERKINENEVVTSLTKYNKIFKNITMRKLNNYMMYLDKKISINVDDDKIVVTYDGEPVKDKNDSIDDVTQNYIKTIKKKKYSDELKTIKKKKIYSDELKAIISKRSDFIKNDIFKIKLWEDDNNIISNNVIDELIQAKERLDVSTAEAKEAEAKATATSAEVEETTDVADSATAAADSVTAADVEAAKAAVEAANANLKKYIENAGKSPPPFDDKIKDVKDYLMNKDVLDNKELIDYAGLNDISYEAIQSINTLDEDVYKFNKIFNIYIN